MSPTTSDGPQHRRGAAILVLLSAALLATLPAACSDSSSPTDPMPRPGATTDPASIVEPACANPAPLDGEYHAETPGYLVFFRDGVDAQVTAHALEVKYGFTLDAVLDVAVLGFTTEDATPVAVAGLRCEPTVRLVEHNQPIEAF